MTANRINRLINLLAAAIEAERGVRKIYYREAFRCLNNAGAYLEHGDNAAARFACGRAVSWYELTR